MICRPFLHFPCVSGAVLFLTVLVAGCGGTEERAGGSEAEQQPTLGERIYQQQCATCHQADGEGIGGVYPTLHETKWTEGDAGRLIRLVLHGMEGPVEVKGLTYDQRMQPLSYLSDEEIAAVLTFVREHFGNEAAAVQSEEVAAVRAATADRSTVWAPSVLWEQTGIPTAKSRPAVD